MTKSFHSVEWMRNVRAQIDEEDKGLSWNDKSKKTIKKIEKDPLWQKFKGRTIKSRSPALL